VTSGTIPLTADEAQRLDSLYRRYAGLVTRVAAARTRTREDAADVAGETWARAAGWLPSLRADDDRAGRWLAVITRRAAIDMYRPKRSTERPMDWADKAAALLLTVSAPAEDEALAVLAVRETIGARS
jgi:DNA-directed RNA polymerase specialized sigma24 family protein